METPTKISSVLMITIITNFAIHAQGPNSNIEQQINVMPIYSGGPNGIGGQNINVLINDNNIGTSNIYVQNVHINTNPSLSNVSSIAIQPITTVAAIAKTTSSTTNVVKTTVNKPAAPVAINNVKTVIPQQNTNRIIASTNTSLPQRSIPAQQTTTRAVTPISYNYNQRNVSIPAPKPVATPIPTQRIVAAPAQPSVNVARALPVIQLQSENNRANEILEAPVQQQNYSEVAINPVIENNSFVNPISIPKVDIQQIALQIPSGEKEADIVVKNDEKVLVNKSINEREFSSPSLSINSKNATSRIKIKAPKKGNKNYYTQKYATKTSIRVRFTQTKKAIKAVVKPTAKKKVKIAAKVCYVF